MPDPKRKPKQPLDAIQRMMLDQEEDREAAKESIKRIFSASDQPGGPYADGYDEE